MPISSQSNIEKKRVFFGCEVIAPWPQKLPNGRIIAPNQRHLTLAFLGTIDIKKLLNELTTFPIPSFYVGMVGKFDHCLFLPVRHPNVVSWNVFFFENSEKLFKYQKIIYQWLLEKEFNLSHSEREWLPHVSLCRQPFNPHQWQKAFAQLPMMVKAIHLYESCGNLTYLPIWSHSLIPPFEELDHTADIAFNIYGENIQQVCLHAQVALSFIFPPLVSYLTLNPKVESLEDIVIMLNEIICQADSEIGCPMKAISFHGNLSQKNENVLQWEMIIDV